MIVTPELNNSVIGWIYNESYRSLWKVARWYDFEDLVQDGLMIAIKCRQRYGDVDLPHFTALVKTSFKNHISSLQHRNNCNGIEYHIAELADIKHLSETQALDKICDPELPQQEIACTLGELPEPIKTVLRLFLSKENLRRLRLPLRATLNDEDTPAKRLKRLAGWPEEQDFESELQKRLFPS